MGHYCVSDHVILRNFKSILWLLKASYWSIDHSVKGIQASFEMRNKSKTFFWKKSTVQRRFNHIRMCFNKISMWHPTIFLSTFPNILWMHWKEACFSIFWFYWWAVTLHPLWAFHPFPWLHKGCRKVFSYYFLRWNTGCSMWKNYEQS